MSRSAWFTPQGLDLLTRVESGGNRDARNPRSTATGPQQFTERTWLAFAAANPHLFRGMDRGQVLAQRTDPELSAQATQWYAAQNARALQAAGIPVTDATLAMAHTFGGGGARALWAADPNTPAAVVLGEHVVRANPHLQGRTAGDIRDRFAATYDQPLLIAQAPNPPAYPPTAPVPATLPSQEAQQMDLFGWVSPQMIAQYLAGGARPGPVDPAGGGDEAGLATRYGYAMTSANPAANQAMPNPRMQVAQALMGGAQRMLQQGTPMPVPQFQNFSAAPPGRSIGGPPTQGLLQALNALQQRSVNRFGGF